MNQADGTDLDHGIHPGCRRILIGLVVVILTIITICVMAICSACQRRIPEKFENNLVITKKYSGRVISYSYANRFTTIKTDQQIIIVCGYIHIPDSAHCYIRTLPVYADVHPDIKAHLEKKYFSYNGEEFRIKTW